MNIIPNNHLKNYKFYNQLYIELDSSTYYAKRKVYNTDYYRSTIEYTISTGDEPFALVPTEDVDLKSIKEESLVELRQKMYSFLSIDFFISESELSDLTLEELVAYLPTDYTLALNLDSFKNNNGNG